MTLVNLKNMTVQELQVLKSQINDEIMVKKELRQKELWGNVVAAMKKYLSEFDEIDIISYEGFITPILKEFDFDSPGRIGATEE